MPVLLLAPPVLVMAASRGAHHDFVLYTFGDSILDCGRYDDRGVHPGQLLLCNNEALFPEFRGNDLQSRSRARLVHGAVDGATVANLPAQARGLKPSKNSAALVTVGGNDLLQGLAADQGPGLRAFGRIAGQVPCWPGGATGAAGQRLTPPSVTTAATSWAWTPAQRGPTTGRSTR